MDVISLPAVVVREVRASCGCKIARVAERFIWKGMFEQEPALAAFPCRDDHVDLIHKAVQERGGSLDDDEAPEEIVAELEKLL